MRNPSNGSIIIDDDGLLSLMEDCAHLESALKIMKKLGIIEQYLKKTDLFFVLNMPAEVLK